MACPYHLPSADLALGPGFLLIRHTSFHAEYYCARSTHTDKLLPRGLIHTMRKQPSQRHLPGLGRPGTPCGSRNRQSSCTWQDKRVSSYLCRSRHEWGAAAPALPKLPPGHKALPADHSPPARLLSQRRRRKPSQRRRRHLHQPHVLSERSSQKARSVLASGEQKGHASTAHLQLPQQHTADQPRAPAQHGGHPAAAPVPDMPPRRTPGSRRQCLTSLINSLKTEGTFTAISLTP